MKSVGIFASSRYVENYDDEDSILNLIDYSIISNSDSIEIFFINEFFVTDRARLITKLIDSFFNLFSCFYVEPAECFKDRLFDFDLIFHKPSWALASFHEIDSSFLAVRAARMSERSSEVNLE